MSAHDTWHRQARPTHNPGGALGLSTYVLYRVGVGCFEIAFGLMAWAMALNELRLEVIFAVAAVTMLTSAALWRWQGSMRRDAGVGALFVFDLLLLSVFLGLTGGPSNPFAVLYLVQVTLASMLFRGRLVWAMMCSASLCYGALFWWHDPLPAALGGHDMGMSQAMSDPHHDHGQLHAHMPREEQHAFSAHLQGMWLAFTLTAALLTMLVTRVTQALEREQARRVKTSRLLSLTTLAAGAAHELGGPLATIKVAAGELRHLLAQEGEVQEMVAETELIDAEIERARHILDRMTWDAGQLKGEGLTQKSVREVMTHLSSALEVEVDDELVQPCQDALVMWPLDAITTMIEQLIKNAREANAAHIQVSAVCEHEREVVLSVEDDGEGLSDEILERVGEPFLTTKETGLGMGLGLFLGMSLCEQLGGELTLANRPGHASGCVVRIRLPLNWTKEIEHVRGV